MKPGSPKPLPDVAATGHPDLPAWIVPLLDDDGQLCGSGVVVTSEYILTCNHVAGRAERTHAGNRLAVACTEPDERLDLALLRCAPTLQVEPVTFLTARESAERIRLDDARVCYWHHDAQGLRALTAYPAGLSTHTDARGLHFINLPEGLPHGASGGAGVCHTMDGPACFGIVRWGGDRRPCSTLTGADAVGRFLATGSVSANPRWVHAHGSRNAAREPRDPVSQEAQARCRDLGEVRGLAEPPQRTRKRSVVPLAGTLGTLSLLGAALWSAGGGPWESRTAFPPLNGVGDELGKEEAKEMVAVPGGILLPGSHEGAARADFLACTQAQGPDAALECGPDFITSIFAREVRPPQGKLPARVKVAAFLMDRREVTAGELAAWLSRPGSGFHIVRDPEKLQAWGMPAPVVLSRAGRRVAAVRDGWEPAPESVTVRALDGVFEVAPEVRDQPARLVSWYGARAYCGTFGKRLPTHDEWEWAARGRSRSRFPWGDRPVSCADAVFGRRAGKACAHLPHGPQPATPTRDRSPLGLLDLAGNVSEWTATPLANGLRQVRGGHYADAAIMLAASRRSQAHAEALSPHVGFRCARDAEPVGSPRDGSRTP